MNNEIISKLTEKEKLELQNVLLRIQLFKEKENSYSIILNNIHKEQLKCNQDLDDWKNKYNKKLKKLNLNIEDVDIDSDSGIVTKGNKLKIINQ